MVAWRLPLSLAQTLALPYPDAEAPEDLHLTLCFFPDFSLVDTAKVEKIMGQVLEDYGVLDGEIAGYGRFSASGSSDNKDVLYASVDVPGLEELRQDLVERLEKAGQPISHAHGYTPHITLMYLDPGVETPVDRIDHLKLSLNHLILSSPDSEPLRVGVKAKRSDNPFDAQYQLDVAAYKLKIWDALEKMHKRVIKEMHGQGLAVKAYGEKVVGVGTQTFWDEQRMDLESAVGASATRLLQSGALQAKSLGVLFDGNAVNENILGYASTYMDSWWQALEGSTRDGLRDAISEHIRDGTTTRELSDQVAQLFGETRADRIAATEVTRLYAEGNSLAYQDAGVDSEWQTVGDSLVDEDCSDLEGMRWPAGEEEEMPPAHVNCRCWLAPVIPETTQALTEPLEDAEAAFSVEQAPVMEEYRSFASGGPAETWLMENAGRGLVPSGLTDIQLGALSDYRQSSLPVNSYLRRAHLNVDLSEKVARDIESLDGALAKTAMPENITAYRGMADIDAEALFGKIPQVGDSFIDRGFVSTTLNPEKVGEFTAGGRAPTTVEIRVRAGSQSLSMTDVPGIGHYYAPEQELLLPRNTRFTVVGRRADGVYILEAETPNLAGALFQAEGRGVSMSPGAVARRAARAGETAAEKAARLARKRDERATAAGRRGVSTPTPPPPPSTPIPIPDNYGKRVRARTTPERTPKAAPGDSKTWTQANYKAKFAEAHPNQKIGAHVELEDARAISEAIKDMPQAEKMFADLTWGKPSDKSMQGIYRQAGGGRSRPGEIRGVYTPGEHSIRINAEAMPGGDFYNRRPKWSAAGAPDYAGLRETIAHEYGHALVRMKTGTSISMLADIHRLARSGLFVSEYGQVSTAEWVAEVISRYYHGTGGFDLRTRPEWRPVLDAFRKMGLIE